MENTYYHSDHETARRPHTYREIKAMARENLLGNYKYIIFAALFIQIVGSLINSFFTPAGAQPNIVQYAIYYVATFIITLLINLFYAGVYTMHLKAGRGETVSYADLNYALKNGTNRFLGVSLVMAILSFMVQIPGLFLQKQLFAALEGGLTYMPNVSLMCVITLIAIIIYVILMLGFSFSYFLLIDNPQMGAIQALSGSWRYMKGNKRRLFLLFLSFIGLILLSILTFMIAFLWVQPYMEQSMAVLYETVVHPEHLEKQDTTQNPNAYY